MSKKIGYSFTFVFACVLSSCATGSIQDSEDDSAESITKEVVENHLEKYMYCVTDLAQSRANMKSDVQSIAVSAMSDCELAYEKAKEMMRARLESNYPDEYKYRGRQKADETMERIRESVYQKAISLIVQKRG